MSKRFHIYGGIGRVVTCAVTTADMAAVPVLGFGVGAGAIGRNASESLASIGDATVLFGTVFVSLLPTRPQWTATAEELADSDRQLFAPVMAQFHEGQPDLRLGRLAEMSVGELLQVNVLKMLPDATSVGCVSLVRARRRHVVGALIATSVAEGGPSVPAGARTTEAALRSHFFDLEPMRHAPAFDEGFGWLVSACMRGDAPDEAGEAFSRFVGRARSPEPVWHTHTHTVLTSDAPDSWLTPTACMTLSCDDAAESVRSQRAEAFAFHADDGMRITPLATVAWAYNADQTRIRVSR